MYATKINEVCKLRGKNLVSISNPTLQSQYAGINKFILIQSVDNKTIFLLKYLLNLLNI